MTSSEALSAFCTVTAEYSALRRQKPQKCEPTPVASGAPTRVLKIDGPLSSGHGGASEERCGVEHMMCP